MNDNVFEKIANLEEGQAHIIELLQRQNESATHSNTVPMDAQIQRENEKLTLQRFIRASTKTYHFFGGKEDYQSDKTKTLALLVLTMAVAIIANILTGVSVGLFSTFSLVEDLWFFLVFRMICHVLHSKRFYDHVDYSLHSFETFAMDPDGLCCPQKIKLSYKIIKILALISAPCNIIGLCIEYRGAITVFAIIFEVLVFAAVFFSLYVAEGFFCMYSIVYYSGKNQSGTAIVTLVFDQIGKRLYTQQDYESKFPFAK